MQTSEMTAKIAEGNGFIAALDQSGGSTPKALRGYGVSDDEWSGDEEMFAKIHEMRSRIITSPAFTGDKVIGAILFERTMNGEIDGKPVPGVLHDKGIVPFIKIDKGLEEQANGVQLMKPMPGLDDLLDHSRVLGMFGTKERSVIHEPNREGIAAIVAQQIEIGRQVLSHGLMPILEPETNIKGANRAECDTILVEELEKQLSAMPGDEKVMLKLSIPVKPGHYDALVDHPRVLRVVALSGGYERPEACEELAKNRGMIASFSRALLQDLRASMSDAEFDKSLGGAIDQIHAASTQKTASASA
ncbi:class I fructose-bisphosphate aldolase [Novosphingobium marinum]|uniref:fructose-bisphosphate aldolase n=1 Tax=Novosphingobium marinum TaxID=1514948 RepID=A0A7Y9XTT5_9SPHN|nr:fructose bisphosphate aldolase [Novosphingobium marinum]NYH94466.1 fructose-bisphosphate aldolase class I [Novosphingobium marinum]GGC22529.1 class I fructose-bisphosphate aldolase [Novosphingobium marinum]